MTETPETNTRGFRIYTTLHDTYGSVIRVQESSTAHESRVWIFCDSDFMPGPKPHLNVEQAKMVRAALDRFIAEKG